MIYRILVDGISIYDNAVDLVIRDPSLEHELNSAGSLDFTIPPDNGYFRFINSPTQTIEVYEGETLIWFGRPIDFTTNFNNMMQVHCEGALAFFNDSVMRPGRNSEFHEISIHNFFRALIDMHNVQVPYNRQFNVGEITIPDRVVWREVNYEYSIDCLNKMCLDTDGGYFFTRRDSNGVNWIDWLQDMPFTCNQPVEFGRNLKNLTKDIDFTEMKTSIVPIGEDDLTIAAINNGNDFIDAEAVETYGRLQAVVNFSEISTRPQLQEAAIKWLNEQEYPPLSITIDAADLSYLLPDIYEPFRLGQKVRCTSVPHDVDDVFPLVKISLKLDTAVKQITIGTVPKRQLTDITRPE